MRRIAWTLLIAVIVLAVIVVFSMQHDPHRFENCITCHSTDSSGAILGRTLTAPVSVLCMQCHDKIFSSGYLHPVDVRPGSANIPADFPLSQTGELTCVTCHDVHMKEILTFNDQPRYLRRAGGGREFCQACHAAVRSEAGHSPELGEAHYRARYIMLDQSQQIDPISKGCISCHDGSFSRSASITAGMWIHGRDFIKHDEGSHPIGIDYEAARVQRGRKTDLRPRSLVDRRIRFFEGKIGCGSCHDPYSKIEKRLVMSDRGSRLCLSCHLIAEL